jgi:hypothetical protein
VEQLAADWPVTDDDVISRGSSRAPLPGWWPPRVPGGRLPRIAAILGAAGLLAGLAAGYAVGTWQARKSAPAPVQSGAPAVSIPPVLNGGSPLGFDGSRCSLQVGHDLQLGMKVINDSPSLLTVVRVDALLPEGGLKPLSWAWGPCGELPGALPSGHGLATGNSMWFTVTFQVLVSCPAPLPVQFDVGFDLRSSEDSRGERAIVAAFPDLSQVPYSGCQ